MYWRYSVPIIGGLKYNVTSNGKDYISYRKNGIYMREPVADIKGDIKNLFNPKKQTIEISDVQKIIKDSFLNYKDNEIFNQVALLKQFKVKNDDIADIVCGAIFDGSSLAVDQLNHAKGIFSQITCTKHKKKEISDFIDNNIRQLSANVSPQLPSPNNNTNGSTKPQPPLSGTKNNIPNPIPMQKPVNDVFETKVEIFREDNNQFNKVSEGKLKLENNLITISANVTKSFMISDIAEIYKQKGKLFIHIKSRKQPFIISSVEIDEAFDFIANNISAISK